MIDGMIKGTECDRSAGRRPRAWPLTVARIVLLIGLAAQLLFAHGCHGDDVDHELLTSAVVAR